jgi:hypothetical protein
MARPDAMSCQTKHVAAATGLPQKIFSLKLVSAIKEVAV